MVALSIGVFKSQIPLEFGIIASMFTFIYGFFLGSLLSFIERKYVKFKDSMAFLNGQILSIYGMVSLSKNKKFKDEIGKELIGLSRSFIKLSPEQYERNQDYILRLYSIMKRYKVKTDAEKNIHNRILSALLDLSVARERLEVFGDRYLVGETKVIFIFSSAVLLFIVLYLSSVSPLLQIIGVFLAILVVFISNLMFDLDDFEYGYLTIRADNIEALIDDIGER